LNFFKIFPQEIILILIFSFQKGVLVAKNSLFRNKVPHNQGGGTVLMVNHPFDIFKINSNVTNYALLGE